MVGVLCSWCKAISGRYGKAWEVAPYRAAPPDLHIVFDYSLPQSWSALASNSVAFVSRPSDR